MTRDQRIALQGVCKDCQAGTMNNDFYEAFVYVSDNDDNEFLACKNCGSTHLDILQGGNTCQ